jgi:hypothetical protein
VQTGAAVGPGLGALVYAGLYHSEHGLQELLLNSRPPHAAREARLAVASRKFRFARDSPLEGSGFELSVPPQKESPFRGAPPGFSRP